MASKTAAVCLMWSGIPSHIQTYLGLSGVDLFCVGGDMASLEIIKNERLTEFQGNKSVFSSYILHELSNYCRDLGF